MFIDSVIDGVLALRHWQVWAASLLFAVPLGAGWTITWKLENRPPVVFFMTMLGLPLLQAVGIVLYVSAVAPLILGHGTVMWSTPWVLLTHAPGAMLRLIMYVTAAAIAAGFIPIVGRLPTIGTVVGGCVAIATLVSSALRTEGVSNVDLQLWPGLLTALGFLIAGTLAGLAVFYPLATVAKTALGVEKMMDSRAAALAGMWIAGCASYISVFIYAAWLGRQLISVAR